MAALEGPSVDPPSPTFYKDSIASTWKKDIIKRGLHIDEATYVQIYGAIEERMTAENMLDLRMTSAKNRERLMPVLKALLCEFEGVFQRVPEDWGDKCIRAMVLKFSHSARRRPRKEKESRTVATEVRPGSVPNLLIDTRREGPHTCATCDVRPGSFCTMLIDTRREGQRKCAICLPGDLRRGQRANPQEPWLDLSFASFISILKQGLAYDERFDKLYYRRSKGDGLLIPSDDVLIPSERQWRGAVADMYANHDARIGFIIKRVACSTPIASSHVADKIGSSKPKNKGHARELEPPERDRQSSGTGVAVRDSEASRIEGDQRGKKRGLDSSPQLNAKRRSPANINIRETNTNTPAATAIRALLIACSCALLANAAAIEQRAVSANPVFPKVKGTPRVLGIVTDPLLDRDSCSSARFNTRALWTCRDTQPVGPDGLPIVPVFTTSASWTNFTADGTPALQRLAGNASTNTSELHMYGANNERSFFPLLYDECNDNQAGQCGDNSRYPLWPDSPPMVTAVNADGSILAYTWIKKAHILPDLSTLMSNPAATLYRIDYSPERDGNDTRLPEVQPVNETFWVENEIAFGDYGNLVRNGTAYLWGQSSYDTVALAKVPTGSVEDRGSYMYWANNSWTSIHPSINETGINIPNVTAGGQGTFYFSEPWQSYVWIGQASFSVSADFYITTAPEPYGPRIKPIHFYSAVNGNYTLGAYTLQAEPALLPSPWRNEMYLTYTKNDIVDNKNVYTTPLILVEWE